MTGVVHHGDVGIAGGVGEFADGAPQLGDAEIALADDDVKSRLLEQSRHGVRIPRRVGQLRHLLVVGHADDKRDALVRQGRIGGKAKQKTQNDQKCGSHRKPRTAYAQIISTQGNQYNASTKSPRLTSPLANRQFTAQPPLAGECIAALYRATHR
jgi:hypothetical protein